MAEVRHLGLDEIVDYFDGQEDPRCPTNLKHPLVSVVVIAMMAVLADAQWPHRHRAAGQTQKEFLLQAAGFA